MKLKCRRNDLIDAINIADRAVSVKSTMYILEGIYMEAKNNELRFLSNNLELGIDCSIPAEVEQEGAIVVKASLFSDAVRKLPDFEETAVIEVDEKEQINLSCGHAKFDFSTFKADEFPRLPVVDEEISFSMKEYVLKSMIKQTVYAVSQVDTKPALTGIFFDIKDNTIHMVGCDGYRLAIRKDTIQTENNIKFILPGKTAKELLSILGDSDYEIKFTLSSKHACLTLKNCLLITRLVDGDYLDYNSVLKHKNTLVITTETRKILNSIDRANLIISETAKTPVILKIEDDNVFINCETVIGKVKDQFSVNMNGEPIEIAFNPKYLMDAFKNADCDEIRFSFSTAVNPAVIEPLDGDSFVYIVLPVRLKN